jgi:hypothetical protein
VTEPTATPPIPARLAYRPTVGEVVIPWVNVRLADGGVDFRTTHRRRWEQAWQQGVCQVCGTPLDVRPVVLLGGPNQIASYFTEPPLHPECARYAGQACPMVAGRMSAYPDRPLVSLGSRGTKCPEPGCDCSGWVPHPGTGANHGGEPAHDWWAVWCDNWNLAATPEGRLLGGVPVGERRRRLVSRALCPRRSPESDRPCTLPDAPDAHSAGHESTRVAGSRACWATDDADQQRWRERVGSPSAAPAG